jgi:hypothetical protein
MSDFPQVSVGSDSQERCQYQSQNHHRRKFWYYIGSDYLRDVIARCTGNMQYSTRAIIDHLGIVRVFTVKQDDKTGVYRAILCVDQLAREN